MGDIIIVAFFKFIFGCIFWFTIVYFISKSNQTREANKVNGNLNAAMLENITERATDIGLGAVLMYVAFWIACFALSFIN